MEIRRSVAFVLVLLAATAGINQPSYAQDPTAFNGTWNLDVAKSDFGKKTPPRSVRLISAGTSTSRTWTEEMVDADGKLWTASYKGAVDDQFYPVHGSSVSFAFMKDGSFAIRDKSGKVIVTGKPSLSADGQTMTEHQILHTPDGDVTNTVVYQKAR